jgi:sugar phosphate isomerase/epimerase
MEVACNSYSLRALDRAEAFARLGALGVTAVELWAGHAPCTEPAVHPRAVADEAADHGLALRVYCVGGLFGLPVDEVTRRMSRAIDFAGGLGADLVTAIVDPGAASAVDTLARRSRMRVALENHWYTELARPADVRRALAACSTWVGAAIDVGHFVFLGYDLAAVARELGPRTLHVHLKAVRQPSRVERWMRQTQRRYRMDAAAPGLGDGLDRFVPALGATGYDGLLAVEDESNGGSGRLLPDWLERAHALAAPWRPDATAVEGHVHA